MRLLYLKDDGEFSLIEFVRNIPPYAILSHTWGTDEEEVAFKDFVGGTGKGKDGYRKIESAESKLLVTVYASLG